MTTVISMYSHFADRAKNDDIDLIVFCIWILSFSMEKSIKIGDIFTGLSSFMINTVLNVFQIITPEFKEVFFHCKSNFLNTLTMLKLK